MTVPVPDVVERLRASDYDQLIPFMDRAFGSPPDRGFGSLLPSLYQPTDQDMGRVLAIRRGGRIAAATGVYPIEFHTGGGCLRVAGIGAVSVAPEHRRRGLMQCLMDEVVVEPRFPI